MELFETEWRCKIPSDAINAEYTAGRSPHTAQLFHLPSAINWHDPQVQKQLGLGDVLIFQRNVLTPDVWEALDYWRALGKLVCIDLDDGYQDLPPSNPAFQYWIRNRAALDIEPIEALREGLRRAHFLLSPSKVILQDWAHVVKGWWMPNWTQRRWYEPLAQKPVGGPDYMLEMVADENGQPKVKITPRPDSEGQIILGWGGSISHVDSWLYSGLMKALDEVFEKHPNVRLKFCGHEGRLDEYFKRWGDKVIRQQGMSPQDWPVVISTFDIGLAPLDMRALPPWREGAPVASYDERRSWLKAVEYLCAGVPWVASDSKTYADLRKWGTLVSPTPGHWFEALDAKIKHLKTAKEQAWNNRRWAMKNVTFDSNVKRYTEDLGRMMAEAQVGLGNRMPGITYVVPQKVGQA